MLQLKHGTLTLPIWRYDDSRDSVELHASLELELTVRQLAISSVLAGMTRAEREDMSFQILFANTDPKAHPSYESPWISYVTDSVFTSREVVSAARLEELAKYESEKKWHEKATNDYITALNRCYHNTTAPYITILEGDVLVADGWLARTMLSLKTLEMRMEAKGREGAWLDLRLFNQERSTGFESRAWLGNNVPIIASGAAILVCCSLLLLRRCWRNAGACIDNATIAVICLIVVPATVVLFYQSGKASVLPPSPGVYEEGFGCCSQGLVFNRAHVPELTDYLQQHVSSQGYDMMTRDFGREMGLARWAQYPMLMQHLGFHSILSWNRPVNEIVWSMAFENLDPQRQAKDHEQNVQKLYGDSAWLNQTG